MLEEIKRNLDSIAALCEQHHVQRLELFGSAATDRFDPETSDLDFLVEFREMTPREHSNSYFNMLFALEDLFGRPIDLIEPSAISNPYFLQGIQSTRTLIYAADSEKVSV